MILEFTVGKDILKRRGKPPVIDQNLDYYKCKFYLKEMWKGAILSVTFMNDIGYIETVDLGEYDEVLTCLLPARIALGEYFSFYIQSNDNRKTNTVSVALTNHYQEPEKKCNIVSEIFEQIDEKIDDIIYENFQLKCYNKGKLKNVIYLGNIDEELISELVQTNFDTLSSMLATVAFTGSYEDLIDVPETFTPSPHEHLTSDVTDFDDTSDEKTDKLLTFLIKKVNDID